MANPLSSRVESATRPAVIELLLALFLCLAFLVFMLLQLVYRSTYRLGRLSRVRRNTRFEADRIFNSKSKDDTRRQLVELGAASKGAVDRIAASPPQYGKQPHLPCGIRGEDARRVCSHMLDVLQCEIAGYASRPAATGAYRTKGSERSHYSDDVWERPEVLPPTVPRTMRAVLAYIERQSGRAMDSSTVETFLWLYEAIVYGEGHVLQTIADEDVMVMKHFFDTTILPAAQAG